MMRSLDPKHTNVKGLSKSFSRARIRPVPAARDNPTHDLGVSPRGPVGNLSDNPHPDEYGGYLLRNLHGALRRRADKKVRDAEKLFVLRGRGYTHGQARAELGLSEEEYRQVNRWLREEVARMTLGTNDLGENGG